MHLHVHKLIRTTKSAMGQASRGGRSAGKRGGPSRRGGKNFSGDMQDYGRHREFATSITILGLESQHPLDDLMAVLMVTMEAMGAVRAANYELVFCGSKVHEAKQCPKSG